MDKKKVLKQGLIYFAMIIAVSLVFQIVVWIAHLDSFTAKSIIHIVAYICASIGFFIYAIKDKDVEFVELKFVVITAIIALIIATIVLGLGRIIIKNIKANEYKDKVNSFTMLYDSAEKTLDKADYKNKVQYYQKAVDLAKDEISEIFHNYVCYVFEYAAAGFIMYFVFRRRYLVLVEE